MVGLGEPSGLGGDALWYEYDFGDGWDHVLRVEQILDDPPARVRCTGGAKAGPPEDCGGIGGYGELASWVRGRYDDDLLPGVFDDAAHAHDWLPLDWHPDHFDMDEVEAALSVAVAEPVVVTGEGSHYALAQIRGAKIQSGQDFLVNGATGAIGSAAVQLLKSLGAACPARRLP